MNPNNVVSLKADPDAIPAPFTRVKMTAVGVAAAGATDRAIGIVLPGDLERNYPAVQLFGAQIEAIQGNATAIAAGDELEAAADGKMVKKTTGQAIGVALQAGAQADDRLDAIIYFEPVPST